MTLDQDRKTNSPTTLDQVANLPMRLEDQARLITDLTKRLERLERSENNSLVDQRLISARESATLVRMNVDKVREIMRSGKIPVVTRPGGRGGRTVTLARLIDIRQYFGIG